MRRIIAWNGASTAQEVESMRKSNFALRLQPSLMEEARKAAESEGVALNQLINVALAEKVSALRTEEYFQERDELPQGWESTAKSQKHPRKKTHPDGNLKKRGEKGRVS
jgi:hypothetical protein